VSSALRWFVEKLGIKLDLSPRCAQHFSEVCVSFLRQTDVVSFARWGCIRAHIIALSLFSRLIPASSLHFLPTNKQSEHGGHDAHLACQLVSAALFSHILPCVQLKTLHPAFNLFFKKEINEGLVTFSPSALAFLLFSCNKSIQGLVGNHPLVGFSFSSRFIDSQ
jgi:hypothetical protein